MVMETPSPQCVGREFVRQYYTLMNEAPKFLYRFYSHNSSFVHGGVEKPGEEQPPVMGQGDINDKIRSLNYRDCRAKIRQVDSQSTVGSAVVVQVTGELSNNGQPMRRFMQTFVLAPQSPKKYYVHNDIFRYQDEVFHDNEAEPETTEEAVDSDHEVQEEVLPPETMDSPVTYYDSPPSHPPISNGNAHVEEPVEPPTPPTPIPVPEELKEEVEEPEPEEEPPFEEKEPEKEPEPEPQMETPPAESTENFSWAARAARAPNVQPKAQPAPVVTVMNSQTAVVKPQPPVIKPEVKPDAAVPGQPQPQRVPRTQRPERPRERDNSRPGVEGDGVERRSRYPDSHQLFVGNLPLNIVEKELKTHFEGYGKVVEVRINRKSSNRDVPNFGFVVFEEPATVQTILHSKPVMLGEHRLNVEEKKQRSEQGTRPGSGTRMPGGPRGGRGGGLGTRGGRGGGMERGGMTRGGPDNRGGPPSGRGTGGFGPPRR